MRQPTSNVYEYGREYVVWCRINTPATRQQDGALPLPGDDMERRGVSLTLCPRGEGGNVELAGVSFWTYVDSLHPDDWWGGISALYAPLAHPPAQANREQKAAGRISREWVSLITRHAEAVFGAIRNEEPGSPVYWAAVESCVLLTFRQQACRSDDLAV